MTLNKRIISLAILFAFLVASIAIGTFAWFTKSVELGGADIGTGEIGLTCGSFVYADGALQIVKENIGNENAGEETPEGGTPVEETFSGNDATNSSVSITGNVAFKDITTTPLTFYLIVKKNENSIDFTYAISAFLEGLDPEYDAASGEFKEFDAKNIGGFWYNIKSLPLEFKSGTYDDAKAALKTYITANPTVNVQETDKKSLTIISEDTQKRTFADGTDCHFYALTLGAYDNVPNTSNYFNQRIGIRANIMATQEDQRGTQTHTVGDIGTLRKVMAEYQPGDTILFESSLNVDGDLVFGAPLTLDMGGNTLTVTGNVRFEYDLGYDTTIDTTGGGRLIVQSAGSGVGNAGGDLSIMCPNSLVRLNGTNSADRKLGDIYVQGSFSVRAAYDKGAIFNGCNIYETSAEGGIPAKAEDVKYKTIYVYDSTWVQIANNTTVGDIRVADANVTFFRLLNNGTVNHVYADKVSIIVEEQLISPQIYIYNNGIINGTNNKHITLPLLAKKWIETTEKDGQGNDIIVTKGNTRIVQGFKSNPLDVDTEGEYTKKDIEIASVGDLVEKVNGSFEEIIVNYRDAGNEGATTLQGILEEFFSKTENGYASVAEGYATVKKLTVRTGYGKQITDGEGGDYACIRKFTNLEYIDLTAAETCYGELTEIPVGTDNKTFSGNVYYIPAGAFEGLRKLETILLPSDTQVIRYALMGNTVFAGNIKYPTIVLPDSVVAIEMDNTTKKHALHHFYIVDMPTISTTVQVYVGGQNKGEDEHRIIVPTNKLADYRTEYGSPEEIHWIPTSQFDDSKKYLVHFDDGKYTVTAVLGDVTNVQFTGLKLGGTDITVTGIFDYVFYNRKNIAEANLSDIETIGASAFEKAAVGRFTGLDKVASVGKRAFYDMTWNDAADFALLANIGEEAFAYTTKTAIPSISMPSAKVIGDKAFYNVQIGADGSISIGEANITTSIGASAFENLDAAGKNVTFNGAISEIGNNAFKGAKTGELTFAGDVGTIGNNAFTKATGTSLGAITFGGNIELIKGGTSTTGGLCNVKGTSLTIGGAIKDAENYAIYSLDFTGGDVLVEGDVTGGTYCFYQLISNTATFNGEIDVEGQSFSHSQADTMTFNGMFDAAGNHPFNNVKIDTLTFNGYSTYIGYRCFNSAQISTELRFTENVVWDADSAQGMHAKLIHFEKDVELVKNPMGHFKNATIDNFVVEGTLNHLGVVFMGATLGNIDIEHVGAMTDVGAFSANDATKAKINGTIDIRNVGTLGAGLVNLEEFPDWTFESVETIDTSFNQRKEYGQLVIKSNVGTIKTKAFQGVTVNGDLNFNNVTTIGNDAFAGATINGYVTFKGTVGSIGSNAFGAEPMANDPSNVETATSLHGLTFEGSVTKILQKAFYKLKITGNTKEIHFKDNVTAIGSNAFQSAEVKTIVFEKGLSEIGQYAFANIKGGVTIKILGNIKSFGINMLEGTEAELVLLGVVEKISDDPDTPTTYTMVEGSSIETIGANAFQNCDIDEMYITKVVTIGENSFSGSNIGEVTFLGDVTTIEDSAFEGAADIGTLLFEGSLGTVGQYVFAGGENADERSAITDLVFKQSIGTIGQGTFTSCDIENVTFEGAIGTIGKYSFKNATFGGDIVFAGNVDEIQGEAFRSITAGDVIFRGTVGNLSDTSTTTQSGDTANKSLAFADATVQKIHFEKGVAYIGKWAFRNLHAYDLIVGTDGLETTTRTGANAFVGMQITKKAGDTNYTGSVKFYGYVDTAHFERVDDGHNNVPFDIEGELYFENVGTLKMTTGHYGRDGARIGVLRMDEVLRLEVSKDTQPITISEIYLPNMLEYLHLGGVKGVQVFDWEESTDNSLEFQMPEKAFYGFQFIGKGENKTLVIPSQVETLPKDSFNFVVADTIDFKGVTYVGTWCFASSSIGVINMPVIEELDVAECLNRAGAHTINMPKLEAIKASLIFSECANLTTLNVPELSTITVENAFAGAPKLKELSLPGVTELSVDGIFGDLRNDDGTIGMIYHRTEGYTYIEELSLPNLTNISAKAFDGNTHLKTLKLDKLVSTVKTEKGDDGLDVTTTVNGVFQGMTGIETIELPALTKIESNEMFKGLTSLKEIKLPLVTSISGSSTFSGCTSLSKIYLPALTSISGGSTFSGLANITSVTADADAELTEGVLNLPLLTTISGGNSFQQSGVVNVTLNITSMGGANFANCKSLKTVIMLLLETMGSTGFDKCSVLESVSMPNITRIESYTFRECEKLYDIRLPLVTSVVEGAFKGCSAIPYLGISPNNGSEDIMPLLTKFEGVSVFESSGVTSVNLPHLQSVGGTAFNGCTKLTTVNLPVLTSTGNQMFQNCTSLKNVDIPNLATIGDASFRNTGLETIEWASVTKCLQQAFMDCKQLKTVCFPNITNANAAQIFANCKSLTEVRMPKVASLRKDGNNKGNTFAGSTALQIVELGAIENIREGCFTATTGYCVVIIHGNVVTTIDGLETLDGKFIFIGDNGNTMGSDGTDGKLAQLAAGWSTDNIGYYSDVNGLRYVYTTNGTPIVSDIQLLYCFDETIASTELTTDFAEVGVAVGGTVTSIGPSCYFNTVITGDVLNLGAGITSIGAHAFNNAGNTFKKFATGEVTEIGAYAFQNCTLDDLSLGVKLTKLGKTAFDTTANVRIAQQAANAFSLVLDDADKAQGSTMFGAEAKLYVNGVVLQELIDDGQTYFGAIALTNYENNSNINTDSMEVGNHVDLYYQVTDETNKTVKITGIIWTDNAVTTLRIPDMIDGYKVTQISERAFSGVKNIITELTLPKHLAAFNPTDKEASGLVFYKDDALTALTKYHVAEGCENYYADANGVLYDASKTTLILCPINVAVGENGVLGIPNTVKKFYVYAFYGNENVMDTAPVTP